MNTCTHTWQFQSVVYSTTGKCLPGSGAEAMVYEDKYFCTQCLAVVYKNSRIQGNNYNKAIKGTFPK